MFTNLYNVFKDGEFVAGFDLAPELRRYMNEIESFLNDSERFAEYQVLMDVSRKGVFW